MTKTSHQFSQSLIYMLIGSAIILALSLGVRHGFGLYLVPMSHEFGWGQHVFSLAIAMQNLIWGAVCLLYTSPSPRDCTLSRMPSSA